MVAAGGAPDAAGAAVFDGDFEVDVGVVGGANESPGVGGRDGEGVVGVVGFEGVDVAREDAGVGDGGFEEGGEAEVVDVCEGEGEGGRDCFPEVWGADGG